MKVFRFNYEGHEPVYVIGRNIPDAIKLAEATLNKFDAMKITTVYLECELSTALVQSVGWPSPRVVSAADDDDCAEVG